MEFVTRLPRQLSDMDPQKDGKKNSKTKKEIKALKRKEKKESMDKRKSVPVTEQTKSYATNQRPHSQQLTEEEMLKQWLRMREEVNTRICVGLVDSTYHEILVNRNELNKLMDATGRDSGLSLYKFGVVEDQATCLRFDDFIFFGIPRARIEFEGGKVLMSDDHDLYQQMPGEQLLEL